MMWAPGLSSLDGKPASNIHEWLASADFSPTATDGNIVLEGIDFRRLLQAFAGDLNRVASAGSESLKNIAVIPSIPKSLGWPYVKLYYSALFYAHATLRLWGRSPSYLRTSDLLRVRQTFSVYGLNLPFKAQTGQYLLVANANDSSLVIKPDKGGGGTHEAIWRELNVSLDILRGRIDTAPFTSADKASLTNSLSKAVALLTSHGSNYAWLSTIRNDIQYRQSEGLWFPYGGRRKTSDLAATSAALIGDTRLAEDVLTSSTDILSRFDAACSFIITLARQMLTDLSNIGGAKHFLKYGQAEFERSIVSVI